MSPIITEAERKSLQSLAELPSGAIVGTFERLLKELQDERASEEWGMGPQIKPKLKRLQFPLAAKRIIEQELMRAHSLTKDEAGAKNWGLQRPHTRAALEFCSPLAAALLNSEELQPRWELVRGYARLNQMLSEVAPRPVAAIAVAQVGLSVRTSLSIMGFNEELSAAPNTLALNSYIGLKRVAKRRAEESWSNSFQYLVDRAWALAGGVPVSSSSIIF